MNTTKEATDDYVVYKGVRVIDLLASAKVYLIGITGITVFAPDGYSVDYDLKDINEPFPKGVFYAEPRSFEGSERAFVKYPVNLPPGVEDRKKIPTVPWLLLAYERDGLPLDPSSYENGTGRLTGEGPFRLVKPQRDMLVTALFQTRRFVLLERDLLPQILKEQDMAGTGRVKSGTAPATGGIIGTDLIITGAATEFIADAYGAKGAADAWGTQVDASVNKGYVGLDIRVVDAKTSEVVVATYVMGKAANYGFAAEPGPESKLPVSLFVFARTPAERAIRSAIQKAAADIVSMVPRQYFRY
jgi:hypothetical protein